MNIALFGGSFDPVHNSHLAIAQAVIKEKYADQLWFLPCFQHSFGKILTKSHDRIAMLACATKDMQNTTINTIEIDNKLSGETFDTVIFLKKQHPQHVFSFIIGSDQLTDFHRWKNYQELTELMSFIVVPRTTIDSPLPFKNMNVLTSDYYKPSPLSSTTIREHIKHHESIKRLVPPCVEKYIQDHRLYQE